MHACSQQVKHTRMHARTHTYSTHTQSHGTHTHTRHTCIHTHMAHTHTHAHTHTQSNQSPCPAATFRRHEGDRCRAYEERVREVEWGTFTPLVFSSSGGMGRATTVTYQHLAFLLSDKWNFPYSMHDYAWFSPL